MAATFVGIHPGRSSYLFLAEDFLHHYVETRIGRQLDLFRFLLKLFGSSGRAHDIFEAFPGLAQCRGPIEWDLAEVKLLQHE